MLNVIRKGVDTIFTRILLGLIALSFVGFGGVSFMQGNSKGNVVDFKDTESISVEEFVQAKQQKIDLIQKQNGVNLTESQIEEINLDGAVLQDLISKAMMSYLASIYDFDISDAQVINFVKKAPVFQNENGIFDLKLFKSFFKNSPRQEEEYLSYVKSQLLNTTLLDLFMYSYKVPGIMTDNIVDYMAETKIVDIYKINLNFADKAFKRSAPDNDALQEIYKANVESFTFPEIRSFKYVKVSEDFLKSKLVIKEEELKKFYQENPEEFGNKPFAKAEANVREALLQVKIEELSAELAKNFEDDVASGMTLEEIATKYDLKPQYEKGLSKNMLISNQNEDLTELADTIFEMVEGEISYPIEIKDKNEILLVELNTILPSKQKSFEEVKDDIEKIWQERELVAFNLNNFVKFKESNAQGDEKNVLANKGIDIVKNKIFTRVDLPLEEEFTIQFLKTVFESPNQSKTAIFRDNKFAYFAIVKNSKIDSNRAKKISKEGKSHFENTVRENLMNELIAYLTEKNQMTVNLQNAK